MPRVPDLLHRFLPAGSPGAAGVAGVPADRVADEAAELAPLFSHLAGTETRCHEILKQAERDVAAARQRATDQANTIVATAQQHAASERAAAMARAQQAIQERTAAELAAAQLQAAELRDRASASIADYVARITTALTGLIAAGRSADPP